MVQPTVPLQLVRAHPLSHPADQRRCSSGHKTVRVSASRLLALGIALGRGTHLKLISLLFRPPTPWALERVVRIPAYLVPVLEIFEHDADGEDVVRLPVNVLVLVGSIALRAPPSLPYELLEHDLSRYRRATVRIEEMFEVVVSFDSTLLAAFGFFRHLASLSTVLEREALQSVGGDANRGSSPNAAGSRALLEPWLDFPALVAIACSRDSRSWRWAGDHRRYNRDKDKITKRADYDENDEVEGFDLHGSALSARGGRLPFSWVAGIASLLASARFACPCIRGNRVVALSGEAIHIVFLWVVSAAVARVSPVNHLTLNRAGLRYRSPHTEQLNIRNAPRANDCLSPPTTTVTTSTC